MFIIMCKYEMLSTLVVLMCTRHIFADNLTSNRTASIKTTIYDKLKFRDPKLDMYSQMINNTRRHDSMAPLLEYFSQGVGNKSVFRYSEIQQLLKKNGMEHEIRRAIDALPIVIETANQVLRYNMQNVTTTKTITINEKTNEKVRSPTFSTKKSISSRKTPSKPKQHINGRKTTFDKQSLVQVPLKSVRHGPALDSHAAVQVHNPERKPKRRSSNLNEKNERKTMRSKAQPNSEHGNRSRTDLNVRVIRATNDVNEEDINHEKKKEHKIPIQLSPYSILEQIDKELKPKLMEMNANITVEILGRTMEYRDIVMIKAKALPEINFRGADKQYDESLPEKRIILIVHGLSTMGFDNLPCLSTIDGLAKLMSYYYEHLDLFDIFVIPMANPDGVTLLNSKFWNKNLSPQSECPGVALDRNFDVAWKVSHSSGGSCSQHYPGPEPFSEPESRAVRHVLHKYSDRIVGYFHVHASSYDTKVYKGDAVLYPKGYSEMPINDDVYIDIKAEIDDKLKNTGFMVYSFNMDTLYNWYGKVSGTSVDYAASVYGIPFSMEFVMQLYVDDMLVDDTEERETAIVLTEVWHKVIAVIFKFMHNHLKSTDRK